jgi:thymidylate synthase (FAD)
VINLVWITPNADNLISKMARVSNPAKEIEYETAPRLINYLIRHKHWSPFEMADMCVDITTTRDIGRQILRHRSFNFQEYSLRYASADILADASLREARMQHPTNRQASVECDNASIIEWWDSAQAEVLEQSRLAYEKALRAGIAKEVARAILPEGLTTTRMYMKGSIRSWIHFCQVRMGPETQKETRDIADECWEILKKECPNIINAVEFSY